MSKAASATSAAVAAINLGVREQEARMAPRAVKTERFHLHLPQAAIHALKVRAAEQGITAAQVVLDALKHAGVL